MRAHFENRTIAGQQLAQKLVTYRHVPDGIVLALPRGGVPVGYEIAVALGLPLDICVVRKLGVPGHRELAMGAIAADGIWVLNQSIISGLNISQSAINRVAEQELHELQRRETLYRGDRPQPMMQGWTVILVDDGLATGATMQAAIAWLRNQRPKTIVVAVPVMPIELYAEFQRTVDQVVCLATPEPFHAIGLYYQDFSQTSDAQVQQLLRQASLGQADPAVHSWFNHSEAKVQPGRI